MTLSSIFDPARAAIEPLQTPKIGDDDDYPSSTSESDSRFTNNNTGSEMSPYTSNNFLEDVGLLAYRSRTMEGIQPTSVSPILPIRALPVISGHPSFVFTFRAPPTRFSDAPTPDDTTRHMFNPSAFLNYPRPLLRTASFSSDEDETSSSDSDSSDSTGEAHVLQSTPPKSDLGLDPDLISDAFPLNLSHSVAASQDGDSDWTQKTSTSDHIALEASATSDPGAQILDNAHADAVDGLILLRRPSYTTAIQDDDPMDCEDARHASDSEGRRAANLPAVTLYVPPTPLSWFRTPARVMTSVAPEAIEDETKVCRFPGCGQHVIRDRAGAHASEHNNMDGDQFRMVGNQAECPMEGCFVLCLPSSMRMHMLMQLHLDGRRKES